MKINFVLVCLAVFLVGCKGSLDMPEDQRTFLKSLNSLNLDQSAIKNHQKLSERKNNSGMIERNFYMILSTLPRNIDNWSGKVSNVADSNIEMVFHSNIRFRLIGKLVKSRASEFKEGDIITFSGNMSNTMPIPHMFVNLRFNGGNIEYRHIRFEVDVFELK